MVSFLLLGKIEIILFRKVVLPLPRNPVIRKTLVVSAVVMLDTLRLNNDSHKEGRTEKQYQPSSPVKGKLLFRIIRLLGQAWTKNLFNHETSTSFSFKSGTGFFEVFLYFGKIETFVSQRMKPAPSAWFRL